MQFVFALRKKKVCIIQEHLFFKYMLLINKENMLSFSLSLSKYRILISPLPIPKKQSALKKIKIQLNDEVTI